MKKVLVVCYSRTGTALQLGRDIATALGADFDPIEDVSERDGVLGFLRSSIEALAKGLPSIRTRTDPSMYDLVVLGTPVWTGTMSAPMRAYLFRYGAMLREVALFTTMRGAGGEHALCEMRALCGIDHAPSCVFVQSDVQLGRHHEQLDEFITTLRRTHDVKNSRPTAAA